MANEKSHNFRCQRSSPPKLNNNRNRFHLSKADAKVAKLILQGISEDQTLFHKFHWRLFFSVGKKNLLKWIQSKFPVKMF